MGLLPCPSDASPQAIVQVQELNGSMTIIDVHGMLIVGGAGALEPGFLLIMPNIGRPLTDEVKLNSPTGKPHTRHNPRVRLVSVV